MLLLLLLRRRRRGLTTALNSGHTQSEREKACLVPHGLNKSTTDLTKLRSVATISYTTLLGVHNVIEPTHPHSRGWPSRIDGQANQPRWIDG